MRRQRSWDRGIGDGRIHVDGEQFLAVLVEGEVLGGLKEAELADLFCADATGGEVGDGAGGELEADVGDVDFAREYGEAYGADFCYRRVGHGEEDVEVVNHEVEDDVDIERARREDAEPVSLVEHGAGEARKRGGDGRVEALEVSGGEDTAAAGGEDDEGVGFGKGGGEGFFDKDVKVCLEELCGDLRVRDRGDGDGGGVQPQAGGEEFIDGGKGGDAVAGGDVGAGLGVGVYGCG